MCNQHLGGTSRAITGMVENHFPQRHNWMNVAIDMHIFWNFKRTNKIKMFSQQTQMNSIYLIRVDKCAQ